MIFSNSVKRAISALSRLPGIGPRQATRLVFFLAQSAADRSDLLAALQGLNHIKTCLKCHFINENNGDLCSLCSDPGRDPKTVAVVERETDLSSLERTGRFKGHYLILGDLKKSGVLTDEQQGRLQAFKNRITQEHGGKLDEIILAINPTTFGDLSASLLAGEFSEFAGRVTRLGRGIPTGGEIEFADEDTLSHALKNRS